MYWLLVESESGLSYTSGINLYCTLWMNYYIWIFVRLIYQIKFMFYPVKTHRKLNKYYVIYRQHPVTQCEIIEIIKINHSVITYQPHYVRRRGAVDPIKLKIPWCSQFRKQRVKYWSWSWQSCNSGSSISAFTGSLFAKKSNFKSRYVWD